MGGQKRGAAIGKRNGWITPAPIRLAHTHWNAAPLIHSQPIRAIARITAEIWKDYRVFKAAGLLDEWRKKWAAYLPQPS
jgi:hypothetical protein